MKAGKKPNKVAAAADAPEAVAAWSSSAAAARSFALVLRILGAGGCSRGRPLIPPRRPSRRRQQRSGINEKYLRADNFGIYSTRRRDEAQESIA